MASCPRSPTAPALVQRRISVLMRNCQWITITKRKDVTDFAYKVYVTLTSRATRWTQLLSIHVTHCSAKFLIVQNHDVVSQQRRIQELRLGGKHDESRARTYNGGLGTKPTAGSKGRAPSQGIRWRTLKQKAFQLSNIQWKRKKCRVFSTLQSQ